MGRPQDYRRRVRRSLPRWLPVLRGRLVHDIRQAVQQALTGKGPPHWRPFSVSLISAYGDELKLLVQQHPVCRRLTALEGIGPVCSVLLYATLGTGEAFANGRQFSAYLGLTPKQFSSGGKVNLVGISKRVANRRLRAVLIQGARAYVYHMKEPKTAKDRWLWAIVERSGKCKAAVALANKNVRTAWAMLTQNTEYQRYPLAA